jgi:hypothetical protein
MDAQDASDFLTTGLPVYSIVREVAEEFASKVLDMDDDDARNFGRITGTAASVTSTLIIGSP